LVVRGLLCGVVRCHGDVPPALGQAASPELRALDLFHDGCELGIDIMSNIGKPMPDLPPPIPGLCGEPLELARALVPLLAEHDKETDEARCVPPKVMDAICATGLPWMMVPKRAGGPGERMRCQIEVTAELARGSAGVAWAYGLLCGVTAVAGSLPQTGVRRIFTSGRELVCGVTMIMGTARQVEGGYRVDGVWPYASGSQFASWGMGGVKLLSGEGAELGVGFAFMPIGEDGLSIKDTWHVAGMRGSASNNMVAADVFVPNELMRATGPRPWPETDVKDPTVEPRDRWPSAAILPLGVVAPMLGAARNMLDRTIASLDKKAVTFWDYQRQSDSQVVLGQVGEAAIEIESAYMHVLRVADAFDETAQTRALTTAEQVRLQADCGYAMNLVRRAAERLMDIGGASAFAQSNPLQRAWRDIALGSRHAFLNTPQSLEMYGRSLAGEALQNAVYRLA
jgi:alkylation response protein AidB-like acyl-CoA dehydrogenase